MGNNQEEKIKLRNKIMTVIGIMFSIIFMSIFLCWGGLNIAKFIVYNQFYKLSSDVASIPGIKDGFIASGITYLNNDSSYALVGSMNKNDDNKLYLVNSKNQMARYKLLSNGKEFKTNSTMDIAYVNNYIYLVNEKSDSSLDDTYGIYRINLDSLNESNGTIDIGTRISTSINKCSFLFADSSFIYVGETSETSGNIVKYSVFDTTFANPLEIYKLSANVKGASFINEDELVTISNIDFKDSYIEFYKLNECVLSSSLSEGVITKVLPAPYKTIKGPMLLNGLDLNSTKEKVLIISTSGSSKYIFGSMFFSNKIRELTIS